MKNNFDKCLDKCFIQIFTKANYSKDIILHPMVDENATYEIGEYTLSGREISEDGIYLDDLATYSCKTITLLKKKD